MSNATALRSVISTLPSQSMFVSTFSVGFMLPTVVYSFEVMMHVESFRFISDCIWHLIVICGIDTPV